MHVRSISWLFRLIWHGQFDILGAEIGFKLYCQFYNLVFWLHLRRHRPVLHPADGKLRLETAHPVAFESPDHVMPWGTKYDNSSNKKFILHMNRLLREDPRSPVPGFLDLGCAGGQLVKDFRTLGWMAAGLEGSDYSIKHGRANWPALANRNLFTCDISKPFRLFAGDSPATFDLMTAWEVLEHIHPDDLQTLFDNIDSHLNPGGYFVASTTSSPDLHDGIDRHQSKFSNQEWHALIGKLQPGWRPVNLGLKYYHYVRWNYYERSFLCWRKK